MLPGRGGSMPAVGRVTWLQIHHKRHATRHDLHQLGYSISGPNPRKPVNGYGYVNTRVTAPGQYILNDLLHRQRSITLGEDIAVVHMKCHVMMITSSNFQLHIITFWN